MGRARRHHDAADFADSLHGLFVFVQESWAAPPPPPGTLRQAAAPTAAAPPSAAPEARSAGSAVFCRQDRYLFASLNDRTRIEYLANPPTSDSFYAQDHEGSTKQGTLTQDNDGFYMVEWTLAGGGQATLCFCNTLYSQWEGDTCVFPGPAEAGWNPDSLKLNYVNNNVYFGAATNHPSVSEWCAYDGTVQYTYPYPPCQRYTNRVDTGKPVLVPRQAAAPGSAAQGSAAQGGGAPQPALGAARRRWSRSAT